MTRNYSLRLLMAFALSFSLFMPFHSVSAATSRLYLSPASKTITRGNNFKATILLDAAENVNAVQANLSYPTGLLDVVGISNAYEPFEISAQNQHGGGAIKIARASQNSVAGNGKSIAVITFKAKANGSATVAFSGGTSVVSSSTNNAVPLSTSSASYKVVSPPPPPSATSSSPPPPSSSPSSTFSSPPPSGSSSAPATSSNNSSAPAASSPPSSSSTSSPPSAAPASDTTAQANTKPESTNLETLFTPEELEPINAFGGEEAASKSNILPKIIIGAVILAAIVALGLALRAFILRRGLRQSRFAGLTPAKPAPAAAGHPAVTPQSSHSVGQVVRPDSSAAESSDVPVPPSSSTPKSSA